MHRILYQCVGRGRGKCGSFGAAAKKGIWRRAMGRTREGILWHPHCYNNNTLVPHSNRGKRSVRFGLVGKMPSRGRDRKGATFLPTRNRHVKNRFKDCYSCYHFDDTAENIGLQGIIGRNILISYLEKKVQAVEVCAIVYAAARCFNPEGLSSALLYFSSFVALSTTKQKNDERCAMVKKSSITSARICWKGKKSANKKNQILHQMVFGHI